MTRQRRPSKRADQTVLGFFIVRQVIGLGVMGAVTFLAFQIPDRRLAWLMLPVLLLYAGYSLYVVITGLSKYRQRYGGKP